jgi:hypothetical protein
MKQKTIIKILILFVFIIAYLVIAQIIGNKRDRTHFYTFFNSELKGEIEKIEIKYYGVGFKLKNDSIEYVFYPFTNKINGNKIFNHIALVGDSIVKRRYSDTLSLIKEGVEYKYTFRKKDFE